MSAHVASLTPALRKRMPGLQRRSAEFKAKLLAEGEQPGASVTAIALAHGLNVNHLRKWQVSQDISALRGYAKDGHP